MPIQEREYLQRINDFQKRMKEKEVDIAFIYGNDSEPLYLRYLSNFWPNFEAGALLVPQQGEPTLLTGPELDYYVRSVSPIKSIKKVYELKELSSPIYNDDTILSFQDVLKAFVSVNKAQRLGVVGYDLIPHIIWCILNQYSSDNEIICLDEDIIHQKSVKSEAEQELLRQSFLITEDAFDQLLHEIKPGMTEAEVTACALHLMARKGAEAPSFSMWCASGPNSKHVIHRSTTRRVEKNELINIGIGCRIDGYCSSIGRSLVFGKLNNKAEKLVKDAAEIGEEALDLFIAGYNSGGIADKIAELSGNKGYAPIYGPAHSTGLVECERPWVEKGNPFDLKSGMVFNIDIWLENGIVGTRFEDGIIVKEGKSERMSGRRTGLIEL